MNRSLFFLSLGLAVASVPLLHAEETKPTQIQFEAGKSQAVITGKVTGRDSVLYKLNARKGQFLLVEMLPGGKGADFCVYVPGRSPGDEALINSLTSGRKYVGQLYKTGDHSIDVFLNRAAARRGETAEYKMLVRITDKMPVEEEVPATGAVPAKVISDCLRALRAQIPDKTMKVVRSERGENSFIVDVQVEGVPKPWRCYHDGTKCTGTEYQGEG